MTTIYQVPNAAQNNFDYVCDSQATIDARPVDKKTGVPYIPANVCSVGDATTANNLLLTNQSTWLTKQAELFTVNLQTTTSKGVVWTVVNLSNEAPNTTNQYFVLDPTTGLYTEATGLSAAAALLNQMHQKYLTFTNMTSYTTKTQW